MVTENRLNVQEFLGQDPPEYLMEARPDLAAVLNPAHYRTPEEAVAAWFALFFADAPVPEDVLNPLWRQELGHLLKRHALFAALLKAVQSGAIPLAELKIRLTGQVPAPVRPHLTAAQDALLVLAAWARSPETPHLPLVTLRLQTWLRELRRMVAPLTNIQAEVELRAATDLAGETEQIYLPLIQCSECHTTAWLSRLDPLGERGLSTALDEIYNGWFAGAAETVRLYPHVDPVSAQTEGIVQYACMACGVLNAREDACSGCGGVQLVRVFRTTGRKEVTRGNRTAVYHDGACPVCGAGNALLLIGSRATTLGAQVVEHSWGSLFNDDRKLIAFSELRAGRRASRRVHQRAHLHQHRAPGAGTGHRRSDPRLDAMVESFAADRDLMAGADHRLHMDASRFVAEFIGPNMTWQRAWTDLYQEGGQLPPGSPLVARVQKRLGWQAFAEFTYAGNRGRSLDRLGVATLAPAAPDIDAATASVHRTLREKFGVAVNSETVFWWLWGFALHLRGAGRCATSPWEAIRKTPTSGGSPIPQGAGTGCPRWGFRPRTRFFWASARTRDSIV